MDNPVSPTNTTAENDDQPPPASAQRSIKVELIDSKNLLTQAENTELVQLINKVLAFIPNAGHIRVCIVDDQRMRKDHLQFSQIEGTTDVLTFDLAHDFIPQRDTGFDTKIIDTDLTVCFDEAKRQTKNTSHSTVHELLLYTIHGILHCLGYNDHDEKEYQRMHTKEDELFQQAGLNALFFCDSNNHTSADGASS